MTESTAGELRVVLDAPNGADHELVSTLRRQLQRERRRRLAAETIGERTTAELYDTVRELRAIQAEATERAERLEVIARVGHQLRSATGSHGVVRALARGLGPALGVDECIVRVQDHADSAAAAGWRRDGSAPSLDELPEVLLDRLSAVGRTGWVAVDDRSADAELASLVEPSALLLAPVVMAGQITGWVLLTSAEPRTWSEQDRLLVRGACDELTITLIQAWGSEHARSSVERLRHLDQLKDAFISNVSHELRTPLTCIRGLLELMVEGEFGETTPDMDHALVTIRRNTERLAQLVEDLLTLSVLEAQSDAGDRIEVDLADVVQDARESLLPVLSRRPGVEVTWSADTPSLVIGDRSQLDRVVLNLVTNAVKFTRDGGRVTVALTEDADGCVLEVADTGIGIPAAEQERLFTRFFRSTISASAQIPGTGLGLVLVKTLVERHGGTVQLDSAEGVGTTVTVRIPRSA